jgi:putative transposase
MARLPRLAVADEAHVVLQRGHGGSAIFLDDGDRRRYLSALHDAMAKAQVAVHAYVLTNDSVYLLATPQTGDALGRAMQAVGRRYSQAFNRQHARTGTLWDGRFRSTVVERGPDFLEAMIFIDQLPVRVDLVESARLYRWSSACHHLGIANDPILTAGADYWSLGNTPFDRAVAYGQLLDEPQATEKTLRIAAAAEKGWVLGSSAFLTRLKGLINRPLVPRSRGRPRSMKMAAAR